MRSFSAWFGLRHGEEFPEFLEKSVPETFPHIARLSIGDRPAFLKIAREYFSNQGNVGVRI